MARLILNEVRVHRHVALPFSAFRVLQSLKQAWGLETNAEVLTRLLLERSDANTLRTSEDASDKRTTTHALSSAA